MDLQNFFASIHFGRVLGWFHAAGYSRELAWTLTQLCCTVASQDRLDEVSRLTSCENEQASLRNLYDQPHLPQGAPTSPMLANLVAWNFDHRVHRLVQSLGGRYTRYADDLLISGVRRGRACYLETRVGAIAIEEGFALNFRKTKRMAASTRQVATGLVINKKLNVSRVSYDRLKAILFNAARFGLESQNRQKHPNFRAHLEGRVAWVKKVNPAKGEKLQRMLDSIPSKVSES